MHIPRLWKSFSWFAIAIRVSHQMRYTLQSLLLKAKVAWLPCKSFALGVLCYKQASCYVDSLLHMFTCFVLPLRKSQNYHWPRVIVHIQNMVLAKHPHRLTWLVNVRGASRGRSRLVSFVKGAAVRD